MAAGTLYTYPENFRAFKALIAAQYSGAKVSVASDFKYGETNKTEAYLSKFPLGKVPAFESSCGMKLFGDNAIASFVANEALRGKTASDVAQIQQWIDFGDDEIQPAACAWVFPCLGIMQFNKQNTERSKEDIKKALSALNQHLATRTFLVGERASLADIAVTCNLLGLYKLVLDPEFRKPYQNANRWFVTMVNQPQVKKVIGDFKLADKMAQFDAAKFKEMQGGAQKGGKEKKESKPKPAQQPKKEKPKKEEEEVPDFPVEKPSKDPFGELPKPNFNFDEWKKTYSNSDTNKVAIPYFFDKFDKENLSVWKCEYEYADELGMVFQSCNLISGMFQRLDKMRKHSFGSMILFGENNKSTISGLWFWRGHDLAFELSPDLQVDYSSYKWTKLDYDKEETKNLIKEYWSWEGNFDGKKFNQGKIFK